MSVLQQRDVDSNPQLREHFCSSFEVWVTPMLLNLTFKTVQLAFSKLGLRYFYQVTELLDYQLSVTTPLCIFKVETFPPRSDIEWRSCKLKKCLVREFGISEPLSPHCHRHDTPAQQCPPHFKFESSILYVTVFSSQSTSGNMKY
jgi:hypothetical protein